MKEELKEVIKEPLDKIKLEDVKGFLERILKQRQETVRVARFGSSI